jgi:hypothetical protein
LEKGQGKQKMLTYLSLLLGHLLSWLAVAAAALYVGLVLMRYRTDGPRYRLNFNPQNPARSAQHLAVWLGVKVLAGCVWIAKPILNMLLEASAEVGEWFIRRSPAVQESIRSRFLV